MSLPSVWFVREHALLRRLMALRLLHGSWPGAAAALVETFAGSSSSAELHLYLEARCAQACEFCAQPVQRERVLPRALAVLDARVDRLTGDIVTSGALDALLEACERRRPSVAVTITGHDWLRHPARDAIIDALARHPALPKRLLGPHTGLADPALARRVAAIPGLRAVALTLQAADPAAHDAMVGRPGAFREVLGAIERLEEGGAFVEINTVLTRRAVEHLPRLLPWLAARGWKASLAAFAPERLLPDPERLHPPGSLVRRALVEQAAAAESVVNSLVGVALCVVPAALHRRTHKTVAAGLADPAETSPCARCAVREQCSGVSESYLRAHGSGDLVAFDRRPG
ncbi:MAG: radical SAM protein [Deltaproteobacteria bacterium]|nr:radical SAM protein [Deltaproteobacteria bacterium]